MAIDTEAKRKSAMNVGLLPIRAGVVPDDNNLEAAQRLHTNGLYSGFAAGESGSGIVGVVRLLLGVG